jgi:hypothetical protein
MASTYPLIKIVGVSASGKSTLVDNLRQRGYNARPASQEHSQIPDMWQRIRPPALLIYLHIDLETQRQRRPDVPWSELWLQTEEHRLSHARQHADLVIDTRDLSAQEAAARVLAFLEVQGIEHAAHPLPKVPGTGGSGLPDSQDH